MGCFMPPMKTVQVGKWFALGAPNRLRFLRSHNRTNPRFSSMVIHIWLGMGIWRIIIKRLMIGLTFAPDLMVLLFGTKVFIHGGFPISSSMMLFGLGDLNPQPHTRGWFECGVPFKVFLCYGLWVWWQQWL